MTGKQVVDYYMARDGVDVLYMVRATGASPDSRFYEAMRKVLHGDVSADDGVAGFLKAMKIHRPLFKRGGSLLKLPEHELASVASQTAAIRLCYGFQYEIRPFNAETYLELCRRIYKDVYSHSGVLRDPDMAERMDSFFAHADSGLSGNLEAVQSNSFGPEEPARRFAALESAALFGAAMDWDPFVHEDRLLVLETVRRTALAYGCRVDFSGLTWDLAESIAKLARAGVDDAAARLLPRLDFVGL